MVVIIFFSTGCTVTHCPEVVRSCDWENTKCSANLQSPALMASPFFTEKRHAPIFWICEKICQEICKEIGLYFYFQVYKPIVTWIVLLEWSMANRVSTVSGCPNFCRERVSLTTLRTNLGSTSNWKYPASYRFQRDKASLENLRKKLKVKNNLRAK